MKGSVFLKQVAENIREARVKRGLTQQDIERLCGLMRRHYQSIEAGSINLTLLTLLRLALVFKVSPDVLVRMK